MLLALPPANNDEAMPTSIDRSPSSEAVEPRTGQQTQTLLDLRETIQSSDLTTYIDADEVDPYWLTANKLQINLMLSILDDK